MDWYPRNPRDFDMGTLGMTIAERGAYSCLIDAYYLNEGPLPDDDCALAALLRISIEEWKNLGVKVRVKFTSIDGKLHHERCDEELEKQHNLAQKSRKNGKKGGRPRSKKTGENKDINPDKTQGVLKQNPDKTQTKPHNTTRHNICSLTNVTGAFAPFEAIDGDWKAVLFGPCLTWLAEQESKPPDKLRSLVGRWLSMTGNDARAVVDVVASAREGRVAAPVDWITAHLGGKKQRNGLPSVMEAIGRA